MRRTKHNIISTLALLLIFNVSTPSQSNFLISEKVNSRILNNEAKFSVYLPNKYSTDTSYPVLYLFHGIGGDETSWIYKTEIKNLVDSLIEAKTLRPVLIVMPDGKNSYYINDFKGEFRFEDYFINELVPYIDSNYNTIPKKSHRAICGLSMGGFGAAILPIKHPGKFGTSLIISGAIRTPEQFIALSPIKYHSLFAPIYGDSLTGSERITPHWIKNSPYFIVDSSNVKQLNSVNWYINCGMQDFLFASNKALHELFIKHNISHNYHMRPGNHSWNYWRKSIINALCYWGGILNKEPMNN